MKSTVFPGIILAIALSLLTIAGCSSPSDSSGSNGYGGGGSNPSPTPNTTSKTVAMYNMRFSPASLTIHTGTTITWQNQDSYAHTATSDSSVWNTGNIASGASATTTFNTAGTYPYHCTYHQSMGMVGTIIVQ